MGQNDAMNLLPFTGGGFLLKELIQFEHMKKIFFLCASLCLVLTSYSAKAQGSSSQDYFTGKWNVVIKGTPQGDAKLLFSFEKDGAGLKGVILDSTGKEQAKVDKIELAENGGTFYFNLMGYDLNMELKKKDDDKATGSMMGMFDVEADRVKTPKQLK